MRLLILSVLIFMQILGASARQCVCGVGGGSVRVGSVTMAAQSYSKNSH